MATKFRQHALNLQYVYGTSTPAGEKMTMVFAAADNEAAAAIFDEMVLEEAKQTL